MSAPDEPRNPHSAGLVAFLIATGTLLVAVGLFEVGNYSQSLEILASASVIFGSWAFLRHGGPLITAPGVFALSTGILLGGGSWYWANNPPATTSQFRIDEVTLASYGAGLALWVFCGLSRSQKNDLEISETSSPLPPHLIEFQFRWGLVLFSSGAAMQLVHFQLGGLSESAAYCGSLLLASTVLMQPSRSMIRPKDWVAGAAVLAYYLVVFSGNGRIVLVSLAVSALCIAQYRRRGAIKPLIVFATIPGLLFFASVGQHRIQGTTIQDNAGGLGSLVNPLATFAQLVDGHHSIARGSTFVAEAVVLVPRQVWADKPVQAGRSMALALDPVSGSYGQSDYALASGEWYFNFSWLGLCLYPLVIGVILRWIDARHRARRRRPIATREDVVLFLAWAVVVGGVSDLAWGGTQSWVTRVIQRLLTLAPLYLAARLIATRAEVSQPKEGDR